MLIRRRRDPNRIVFKFIARTDQGTVFCEFVRQHYHDNGFGSYTYTRLVPQDQWERGVKTRGSLRFPNNPPNFKVPTSWSHECVVVNEAGEIRRVPIWDKLAHEAEVRGG